MLPDYATYDEAIGLDWYDVDPNLRLILDRLRHIPREGESIRFGSVLVKVTKASERAVEEVQIRLGRRRSPVKGPGTIPG